MFVYIIFLPVLVNNMSTYIHDQGEAMNVSILPSFVSSILRGIGTMCTVLRIADRK